MFKAKRTPVLSATLRTMTLALYFLSIISMAWAEAPAVESLALDRLGLISVQDRAVSVSIPYTGDANGNAACLVYYCDGTQQPTCEPLQSTPVAMTRTKEEFEALGMVMPLGFAPLDTIRVRASCSDPDGVREAAPLKLAVVMEVEPSYSNPAWARESSRFGKVQFDARTGGEKDLRTGSDFETFRINEDGIIAGSELFSLVRPQSYKEFRVGLLRQGKIEPDENRQTYRKYLAEQVQKVDLGAASLALSRILDHEAMKKRMPPKVSESRVEFALRAVILKNMLARGAIDSLSEVVSLPGCYEILKMSLAEQRMLQIDVDWSEKGQMLSGLGEDFRQEAYSLAPLRKMITELPESIDEFRGQLRAWLQQVQMGMNRQLVLNLMGAKVTSRPVVTTQEVDRLYENMVKSGEILIRDGVAKIWELRVSGVKARAFLARLGELFSARESTENENLKKLDPAAQDKALASLRDQVPQDVLAQTKNEFPLDLKSGELSVELVSRDFVISGKNLRQGKFQGTPAEQELEEYLFSDQTVASLRTSAFIRGESTESGPLRKVYFIRSVEFGKPAVLPKEDLEVRAQILSIIGRKFQALAYREVVQKLFGLNPLRIETNTCREVGWPCVSFDPTRFTEVLFPGETLDRLNAVLGIPNESRVFVVSNASPEDSKLNDARKKPVHYREFGVAY